VETTQLYRRDMILRGFDEDIRQTVQKEMFKKGVDIRVNTDVASIEKTDDGLVATLNDG